MSIASAIARQSFRSQGLRELITDRHICIGDSGMNSNRMTVAIDLFRSNGLWWSLLALSERIGLIGDARRHRLERQRSLPGYNTVAYNRQVWSEYDWKNRGEEWTDSTEWKEALVKRFIERYLTLPSVVLEIGPGAGRWSKILASRSTSLHLVDITETTLNLCRRELAGLQQCHFHLITGPGMKFLSDESVDFVWSFDVFVHIAPHDTAAYLATLSRVMKPGAIAIIHHPAKGNVNGGFRSSVTNEFFLENLQRNGFNVLEQTATFGPDATFGVEHFHDLITVFKREN